MFKNEKWKDEIDTQSPIYSDICKKKKNQIIRKNKKGKCGGQLNSAFKLHWRRPGPISSLICTNSVRKGQAQYPV